MDKIGPALTEGVLEVQGFFADDASLQDAMARLTLAGFDRADISLPHADPAPGDRTPELGAATPFTATDQQQIRTLGVSGAGAMGAIAAAGVTIATGGAAAVAAGAALVAGAAAAGITSMASNAVATARTDAHNDSAAAGKLILSARITDAVRQAGAEAAMRAAGATHIEAIHRGHAMN